MYWIRYLRSVQVFSLPDSPPTVELDEMVRRKEKEEEEEEEDEEEEEGEEEGEEEADPDGS